MKNAEKLEELLTPYYEQFEKLGDLWEDEMLSWSFLKRARKRFGKQYFYELRLFFRAEKRVLRHNFRMAKYKDKKLFKRVWRNVCAKERMQKKAAREDSRIQRKAVKEEARAQRKVTKEEARAKRKAAKVKRNCAARDGVRADNAAMNDETQRAK